MRVRLEVYLTMRLKHLKWRRIAALSIVAVALLIAATGVTTAAPGSMVGVPQEQVGRSDVAVTPGQPPTDHLPPHAGPGQQPSASPHDKIPDSALSRVYTSTAANTLQVDVASTTDGRLALVLTDNQNHSGRFVAIPADAVETATGYRPGHVTIHSETGETWRQTARYRAGYLYIQIPHFSTNTVTFSGEVTVTGNPAADGSSYTYSLQDLDAAKNFSISVTGRTTTEWDNESGTGISSSGAPSISVGGNTDPAGPGATGGPELSVTGQAMQYNVVDDTGDGSTDNVDVYLVGDDGTDSSVSGEVQFRPDFSGEIDEVDVDIGYTDGGDYGVTSDIYIAQEGADSNRAEGTQVKSAWDPTWSTGIQTITFDTPYEVTAGTTYSLQFTSSGSDNDGSRDVIKVRADDSAGSTWMHASNYGDQSKYGDVTFRSTAPSSLSVSDGDGTSISMGDFNDGETKTKEIDLSLSSTELNFASSGTGALNYSLAMQERTQTQDPQVEVNGHTTTYTGILSNGDTANLATNTSWLESGENIVNVSIGDGSLSADAPSPAVNLTYRHSAVDRHAVDATVEAWSERYTASKTYSSDQSNASLTIPFLNEVTKIREITASVDGGQSDPVSTSSYSLDGTTLTVDVNDVAESDLANTTVNVSATGSRVRTGSGTEIKVLKPTLPGDSLDTEFKVLNWSTGSYVDVGPTDAASRIHYLYKESWDAEEHVDFYNDGEQHLYCPGTANGDTARISTIPVELGLPGGGDVRVEVLDAGGEPKIEVSPDDEAGAGDTVDYAYLDTVSGETYLLWSVTHEIVRDSAQAQSPVLLTDDDSSEVLQFLLDDNTFISSSSGDGSGDGILQGGGQFSQEGGGVPSWVVLGLLVLTVVVGGYYVYSAGRESGTETGSDGGGGGGEWVQGAGSMAAGAARRHPKALASALALLGLVAVVTGAVPVPPGLATLAGVAALLVGAYVLLSMFSDGGLMTWGLMAGLFLLGAVFLVERLNPGGVTGPLGDAVRQSFPILALGALYIAYKGVKAWRAPDTRVTFDLGGDDK